MDDKITLDLWSIILLFGSLLGIFLTITLIFHKRGNRKSNILLGTLIFVMSLFLVEYLFFRSGLAVKARYFVPGSVPLLFLIGPLFYFYTKTHLGVGGKWIFKSTVHLIPFALVFINLIPFYLFLSGFINGITDTEQLYVLYLNPYVYVFVSLVQSALYFYFSLKLIRSNAGNNNGRLTGIRLINSEWLKRLTYTFIVFLGVQFVTLPIIISLPSATVEIEYIMFLVSSFIIFMTGFFSIRQPEIISGNYKSGNNVKYEKSGLDKAGSKAYLDELLELMSERKLYLDEDLKMSGVADELKISPTYLSQIINAELGFNFFDFINKYRVEEVKSRLEDPNYSHFTLLGIALECGFSNKTSFNRAFKRFTGITPSQYHKSILIKKSVV